MRVDQERETFSKPLSPFALYLRTGLRLVPRSVSGDVELKFNPWHDPEDGRFTFVGQGRYFGRGGTNDVRTSNRAAGAARANRTSSQVREPAKYYEQFNPKNPRNYSIYTVKPGDTLTRIAALRQGLRVSDLVWLNDLSQTAKLRLGQAIKLPHQEFLEAGRRGKALFDALDLYMSTHDGKLPPNVAKPPSVEEQIRVVVRTEKKNGYSFAIDRIERTQRVSGVLTLGNAQGRSKRNQALAGGSDRLAGDDGGHFIGRRFNGPREKFNHFAQESGFNRGSYRKLEDVWAKHVAAGRTVFVVIIPQYEGLSQRPYNLEVKWSVDGQRSGRSFANKKAEK